MDARKKKKRDERRKEREKEKAAKRASSEVVLVQEKTDPKIKKKSGKGLSDLAKKGSATKRYKLY